PGRLEGTGDDGRGRRARAPLAEGQRGLAALRRVRHPDRQGDPGRRARADPLSDTVELPFETDLSYYEGRAEGIASGRGVTLDEARRDLAARHGFATWDELAGRVAALADGSEQPSPFMLAFRALQRRDRRAPPGVAP